MKKTKYLIIGAGVSGLTFANYIDDDYSKERREYIANGLKEIVDYCGDDDKLF